MSSSQSIEDPMRLVAAIGRVRSALRTQFEASAAAHEVTGPQFSVLRRLWEQDGLNICALMRSAGSDGGTITGVVDRLEAKGLVRRVRDTEDRRAVHVYLTSGGRALEAPLTGMLLEVVESALQGIGASEQAALVDALEAMERNLDRAAPTSAAAHAGGNRVA